MTDLINDFIKKEGTKKEDISSLLEKFRNKTKIEVLKEESFVFKELVNGVPMKRIAEKLSKKYPNEKFDSNTIRDFLQRNEEIVKALKLKDNNDAKRCVIARTKLEEELSGLYLFTKELLKKFDKEGDNHATLGAIKALNQTLVNYCKLINAGGFAKEDQHTNVEVNIGEKRVAKTLEANFKMVDNHEVKNKE